MTPVSGKIFINYRRVDDPGFTQALFLRLEDEFAADNLFMDVEGHIKPGDDFVEVLNRQVAQCDVLLSVIGPRWAELLAARAGDPDDFVAIEIKAALEKRKRVIPVLVGGAEVPRAEALPEAIRPLARRNAVGLRPERFKADCQGLINALKEQLAAAAQERAATTEAERKAAEAERQRRAEEEAQRIAAAEARAKAQSAAGLSAEEIRKAEELANWDFIKDRDDIQDLRDHLARFPGGATQRYALAKLDRLVWVGLGEVPTLAQLKGYLDEFPKGVNAAAAQARVAALEQEAADAKAAEGRRARETEAWGAVAASTDKAAIEAFLKDWPAGQHATAAKARLRELYRGNGTLRRGMLLGAGAMAALAVLAIGGRYAYERGRLLSAFWDVRESALTDAGERALKAGRVFRECPNCPEMVVVPAGSFIMGSPDNENFHDTQVPQHRVTIRQSLAVAKFELTFDEWDACVAHGGCRYVADDSGRGRRPVSRASWNDAKQYVAWLSKLTGKPYRLLTEAEWEYAARAGNSGRYTFGDDEEKLRDYAWYFYSNPEHTTQPVGQKRPNAFGLYDMHGNVYEWVEDCWHDSYSGAPTNGSAWTTACPDDKFKVTRGGGWADGSDFARSAFRLREPTDDISGIRVGRALNP